MVGRQHCVPKWASDDSCRARYCYILGRVEKRLGEVQNGVTTRGPWTEDDSHRHINELELLAALFSLKAFTGNLRKVSVRLMMDNFTAVHYENKSGGTESAELNAIMLAIVSWCESRQIAIQAVYVPGILMNVVADHQSRLNLEAGDWKLRSESFQRISSWWSPQINLFVAAWNRQLDRFISWQPQPDAMAVDAFTLDWGNLRCYAFPPFNLIHKCLLKIWRDQAVVLLLTPV